MHSGLITSIMHYQLGKYCLAKQLFSEEQNHTIQLQLQTWVPLPKYMDYVFIFTGLRMLLFNALILCYLSSNSSLSYSPGFQTINQSSPRWNPFRHNLIFFL